MNQKEEAFIRSIENRDIDSFQSLLQQLPLPENDSKSRPFRLLHHICEADWLEGVELALSKPSVCCDLNKFDEFSRTPLIFAVQQNSPPVVALLLRAGADVNCHDDTNAGNTALIEAVDISSVSLVRALLEAGADPAIRGWMGRNAITKAKLLLEKNRSTEALQVSELINEDLRPGFHG